MHWLSFTELEDNCFVWFSLLETGPAQVKTKPHRLSNRALFSPEEVSRVAESHVPSVLAEAGVSPLPQGHAAPEQERVAVSSSNQIRLSRKLMLASTLATVPLSLVIAIPPRNEPHAGSPAIDIAHFKSLLCIRKHAI